MLINNWIDISSDSSIRDGSNNRGKWKGIIAHLFIMNGEMMLTKPNHHCYHCHGQHHRDLDVEKKQAGFLSGSQLQVNIGSRPYAKLEQQRKWEFCTLFVCNQFSYGQFGGTRYKTWSDITLLTGNSSYSFSDAALDGLRQRYVAAHVLAY